MTLTDSTAGSSRFRSRRVQALRSFIVFGLLLSWSSELRADTVTATWDQNSEPDIAGYILSYGPESGSYSTSIDVGNVTTTQVVLDPGQRYYFVVQAYNTSLLVSLPSLEVFIDIPAPVPPAPGPAPRITSLSPTSGPSGTAVTITGTDFGDTQGTVTFNGTSGTPTTWLSTSLVVPVPAGATSGDVVVTAGDLVSTGVPFTVTVRPTVTSLSPTSGPSGTAVTITGTDFGDTQGTVTFNGTSGTPTTWEATRIVVPVPAGATSGDVVVTAGDLVSTGVPFTVTVRPTITSLLPESGPIGTAVTITGTNFGETKETSTVAFNGAIGTPTTWSATRIVVPVPAGATTGNVVVTVGGLDSYGMMTTFTVSASAPSPGTVTLVQHRSKDGSPATSSSLAFDSNNAAGNLIAVVVRVGETGQTPTVTDSRGNSYRLATRFDVADHSGALYYAENISGGANTVTLSVPVEKTIRLAILEFAGLATSNPLDGTVMAQGTGMSVSSGSLSPTASGDLLLSAVTTSDKVNVAAGVGFTVQDRVPDLPEAKLVVQTRLLTSSGTASGTATLGRISGWGTALVAFKRAVSGDPQTGNRPPVLTQPADQTSVENAVVALQLLASDPDNTELTYSATGLPPLLSVNPTTGLISGTLARKSAGSYSVTATASDGVLASSRTFTWTVRNGSTQGDFDGDGKADVAVYRPSSRQWRVLRSRANYWTSFTTRWGASSVVPVTGDYDGDGRADIAYYRASSGVWSILKSSTNYSASQTVSLGTSADVPVPGDYDGDGATDVAVYQPATGQWQILKSTTGYTTSFVTLWGAKGDLPVPGDYDGDGRNDIAVYRSSTTQWHILQSSTNYEASITVAWGRTGDIPMPGDYDGDGKTDIAMYRPLRGVWNILWSNTSYATSSAFSWGRSSEAPVAADYDGDGKADLGLFRNGSWRIRLSARHYSSSLTVSWGRNGDVPLPKRP